MADKLAKEGDFQLNNNDKNVKLNFSTIKSLIHRNNYEKWVNDWKISSIHCGSFYRNIIGESIPTKSWFHKLNLPRKYIITWNRLRSGHTRLKSDLKRIGILEEESCDCGLPQNIQH